MKGEAQLGALEGAMHAAVRDYKKGMVNEEDKSKARQRAINEEEVCHPSCSREQTKLCSNRVQKYCEGLCWWMRGRITEQE